MDYSNMKPKEIEIHILDNLIHSFRFKTLAILFTFRNSEAFVKSQETLKCGTIGTYTIKGIEFEKDLTEVQKTDFLKDLGAANRNYLIREVLEELKFYCKVSTQKNRDNLNCKLNHKYVDTLNYARVLRNCASHIDGVKIIRWDYKGFKEIKWRNRTINTETIGDDVRITDIELIELVEELKSFIDEILE